MQDEAGKETPQPSAGTMQARSVVGAKKQMTLSQMSPKQRREIIRENIIQHTTTEIAEMCHVTKRTITRDIARWKREGGFEEFLMDEFFKSYPNIKKDYPDKAFDRLCYLLSKTITQKRELTEEVNVREEYAISITNNLSEYDAAIEAELKRVLAKNNPE